MEELFLNDIRIELPEKSVGLNLQVNDLSELKNRQSNYSNNINIPFTDNNISTMDLLGITGSLSEVPYKKVKVKYVVSGIELISDGIGKLTKSTKNYSLVVYSGNNSMTDLLGNKQLNELNFSAYNHSLNKGVFLNSFTNTSGYIYGLAKYWSGSNTTEFPVALTTPVFYVHTLWDMIFSSIGKTTSGIFLQSSDFKSRVISMSKGYDQSFNLSLFLVYNLTHTPALDGINDNTGSSPLTKEYIMDTFTATSSKSHRIQLSGSIEVFSGENVGFTIKRNGVLKDTISLEGGDFNYSRNIDLKIGDTINIYIQSTSTDTDLDTVFESIINPSFTTIIQSDSSTIPINFDELIGDTTQVDFIKEIMQHFGLMYREVPGTDNYEFIRIKELLKDKTNAEDWSDKFSETKSIDYVPSLGQINRFKYNYDDTDVVGTFADGEMLIDNFNIPKSKTLITSILKASVLEDDVNVLRHWSGDDTPTTNDDGLRMFKLITSTSFYQLMFHHDSIGSLVETGAHPVLSFSQLYYQNEITNNYLEYQSMYNRYKGYTLKMNFNIVDIYNADFFKLKYIKQLGGYFYLNKIKNFKNNKTTEIQLIKLGEDVIDLTAIEGNSGGTSTALGTLTVLAQSSVQGTSIGTSTATAFLSIISPTSVTAFNTSKHGLSSSGGNCPITDWTRYHDGSGGEPVTSDIVYTDSLGTLLFNGGLLWYAVDSDNSIQINSAGVVTNKSSCTSI